MGHTDSARHIVKGYTINEQRFREQSEKLTEMRRTVELLARTLANQELVNETESRPVEKETIVKVIVNLINRKNG